MIKISNFTFRHSQSSDDLFRSFCCTFQNEITCIVGKNGVGKSSLFEVITDSFIGFKKSPQPSKNQDLPIQFEPRTSLEIIHQKPDLSILPWYDSVKNLSIICKIKNQSFDKNWFENQLEEFKINPNSKMGNLSGGQKQVVNILQAIALEPNLLLMDEPFGALDMENSTKLKQVLTTWQSNNKACIILVSHSIGDILELSDRILILDQKPIQIIQDLDSQQIQQSGKQIIQQHFVL
jgi:NitT/TauT family transport system ATP-binding protein